ncbi:hypothetical protein V1517DRAFT_293169 [Lipomyces orientalis]|uniref:Uncharacterized protein n=1 Tax=Lipomyces orientalis TaxID=1233043 RepID=A0ACC3TL88_9ASCO
MAAATHRSNTVDNSERTSALTAPHTQDHNYSYRGRSDRRNANPYQFETGPYSARDRVHSFTAIGNGSGARYPAWFMSFLLFAFFQAVFAIIPLGVVAYFISLIRAHNTTAQVPQPYVILISAATITSVVILVSTVAILYHFRNTGIDSHSRHDESEFEDEENAVVGGRTIDIDTQAPGYLWPFVFVMSQILMSVFWVGIFVYIMLLSGGISTTCVIPNADELCTGLYKELCESYITACHLVNLIVVSCALDACFWVSGTISMFINSAITYRKRSLSGFQGIAEIFSSRQPTTLSEAVAAPAVRSTSRQSFLNRSSRRSRSTQSVFWRLKKKSSSDSTIDGNMINLQCMSNSTTVTPNQSNTTMDNSATVGAVGHSNNPFEDVQSSLSHGDGAMALPTHLRPRNNSVSTIKADSILSYSHRHHVAHTPPRRPSSSSYVQLDGENGGIAAYPPLPAQSLR